VTMDAEFFEILMNEVATMWTRPLLDVELDQWRRMLRPDPSMSLDPDLVAETLVKLKQSPQFDHQRPDVIAFRWHYDKALELTKPKPVDPKDKPSTLEQAIQHLDAIRDLLTRSTSCYSPTSEVEEQEVGML
jgi:hypothetical protein